MSSITLFRGLLVASILFGLFSFIAGESLVETLPQILQDYLTQVNNEEIPESEGLYYLAGSLIFLILIIVSLIGVWKFKSWARSLYVVLMLGILPFYILFGPVVMNPWEAMFDEISVILEGITLAMMFSGEVGNKFKPIQAENHN